MLKSKQLSPCDLSKRFSARVQVSPREWVVVELQQYPGLSKFFLLVCLFIYLFILCHSWCQQVCASETGVLSPGWFRPGPQQVSQLHASKRGSCAKDPFHHFARMNQVINC